MTDEIPDQVSTATGMPVASAMRKTLALALVGKAKKAIGSHAVAGKGPITRRIG